MFLQTHNTAKKILSTSCWVTSYYVSTSLRTVSSFPWVATFSFDPTRRYWIYRRGDTFLKLFTKMCIEKWHIINKITYIRNKFYLHIYFLFFETLFSSSTCSGLFRKSRKSAHVMSKFCAQFWFDKFHSHAVSSVGPGIAKDRKNPLDMRYWWGLREFLLNTELYCSLYHIRFAMCNVAISPNKIQVVR
jgi:hypothetical protein